MKRVGLFISISTVLFAVIVTVISVFMGQSIYGNNNKTIANNVISVYVTDLKESIRDNLMLGKTMENYFSLGDTLAAYRDGLDEIEDIYVTDGHGSILAGTGDVMNADPEVAYLRKGYLADDDEMYCASAINDELYLVAVARMDFVNALRGNYYDRAFTFAVIGCIVAVNVLAILFVTVKDKEKARKAGVIVFSVWIFVLGLFITLLNYRAYQKSVTMIEDVITDTYERDLQKLRDAGVEYEYVSGIEEYMTRYIDDIDEIAMLTEHEGSLTYTISRTYMNRVIMGYLVQTLLIYFFSMIIMAEFNIFIQDNLIDGGKVGPESD